ncbi:hypothetical protein ACOMHN_002573 [Nucella lapillus]
MQLFSTVLPRPVTRDRAFSLTSTKLTRSRTDMSSTKDIPGTPGPNRPSTQGGPRVLFSREHTIVGEKDDGRRHLYTSHSTTGRLKSRADDKGSKQRQPPLKPLSCLSEEE